MYNLFYTTLDLQDIREDTEWGHSRPSTSTLDDETVGEVFSRELDDVVTALQRSKGMGARVSIKR